MAKYTYGQLEELRVGAGGSKTMAPLMAAIALAESGGDPAAENAADNGGKQTSWGLWQISDGTHNQPAANILDPRVNARQAVAKYEAQGLGAWGTYTSGAYKRYYKGDVPPGQLPQGGTPGSPVLTGFPGGGGLGWLNGPLGLAQAATDWVNKIFDSGPGNPGLGGVASGLAGSAQGIALVAAEIADFLKAIEWFFVPSHWVRIIAALAGVLVLIPGLHSLMQSAQGGYGDATLAVGILLVTISGVLLFIAFHNLPDDVKNIQTLLGWITKSVSEGRAADSSAGVETV